MARIKQFIKDKLQVQIYDNSEEMGLQAANLTADLIRRLLETKENVNMIFAAAPSQNSMLYHLVQQRNIDWTRINAFHMDEYIGLPENAEQSFGNYLKTHIFSFLPFKSINYLSGNASDLDSECQRYSELLSYYPVDIVCLGIGENGHIAFNDPWNADFADSKTVKIVVLDPVCRQQQVNDGCFAKLDDVPEKALTLTIPALVKASHMICCVPHLNKRLAVKRTIFDEISVQTPATVLRNHDSAVLFCDRESGKDIL